MSSPTEPIQEDLKPSEKKALIEFRLKLEEAIITNQLLNPPQHGKNKTRVANSNPDFNEDPTDVSLWGVPLLPSKCHVGTDVILLKFLRAREFKPLEALEMLQRTLKWRREFGIETISNEELGLPDLKGTASMNSVDKEGHPICYNIYGVFKEKDLYQKTFGNGERRERFLRWRVQFMERGIKQLSFKSGEVGSMVQVIDLKDSMRSSMKELWNTVKKVVSIFQDNYPEFVAKHIFVNVSFRYYAYHALFSHFFTQRTRSKFIFARPSKVNETLLKFIAPENIPIQYGGLQREDDDEFTAENRKVSELIVRGGDAATIEFPIIEPGVTVVWDIAVAGWEVYYKEEFIPDDECSYKVLIQKEKKLEETVRNSFYISEPGKVVLTIDNRTFKKKRVLHRSKSKPTVPLYNLLKHPIV